MRSYIIDRADLVDAGVPARLMHRLERTGSDIEIYKP